MQALHVDPINHWFDKLSALKLSNHRLFVNIFFLHIFSEFDPDRPRCTSSTISTIGSICRRKLDLKLHYWIFLTSVQDPLSLSHIISSTLMAVSSPLFNLFGLCWNFPVILKTLKALDL